MDRKGIGILGVSVALLIAWWWGLGRIFPSHPQPLGDSNQLASAVAQPEVGANRPPLAPPGLGSPLLVKPQSTPSLSAGMAEQLVTLENDKFKATFTSIGGGLKFVELKKYPAQVARSKEEARELATLNQLAYLPAFSFAYNPELNGDGAYSIERESGHVISQKRLTNGLIVTKEYTLLTNYQLSVTVKLANTGTTAIRLPQQELVVGSATPMEPHETSETQGVYWFDGDKAQHVDPRWFANKTLGCLPGTPRTEYNAGLTNVDRKSTRLNSSH